MPATIERAGRDPVAVYGGREDGEVPARRTDAAELEVDEGRPGGGQDHVAVANVAVDQRVAESIARALPPRALEGPGVLGLGPGPDSSASERAQWRTKPKASLDNFMLHDGELWVTGHPKGLKFLAHSKRPKVHAPTIAYRIALDEGASAVSIEPVAHWRDGEVDAGSTVWPFAGQLD